MTPPPLPDPQISQLKPDRSTSVPFGTEKTAEDWVSTAGWWINELGDALPEASPMFKALVDVLKECQRRGGERDRLRAENTRLRDALRKAEAYATADYVGALKACRKIAGIAETALASDEVDVGDEPALPLPRTDQPKDPS